MFSFVVWFKYFNYLNYFEIPCYSFWLIKWMLTLHSYLCKFNCLNNQLNSFYVIMHSHWNGIFNGLFSGSIINKKSSRIHHHHASGQQKVVAQCLFRQLPTIKYTKENEETQRKCHLSLIHSPFNCIEFNWIEFVCHSIRSLLCENNFL